MMYNRKVYVSVDSRIFKITAKLLLINALMILIVNIMFSFRTAINYQYKYGSNNGEYVIDVVTHNIIVRK